MQPLQNSVRCVYLHDRCGISKDARHISASRKGILYRRKGLCGRERGVVEDKGVGEMAVAASIDLSLRRTTEEDKSIDDSQ